MPSSSSMMRSVYIEHAQMQLFDVGRGMQFCLDNSYVFLFGLIDVNSFPCIPRGGLTVWSSQQMHLPSLNWFTVQWENG